MLHADKQTDGSFALTSNSVDGRVLPEEKHYAAARALLLDFFSFTEVVENAVKTAPKFGQGKVAVAVRRSFSRCISFLSSLSFLCFLSLSCLLSIPFLE